MRGMRHEAVIGVGTPYALYLEGMRKPHKASNAAVLALVMVFGLGAHASTHALPVAAPLLEALGLSPISYAVLSICPILGHALTASLWGKRGPGTRTHGTLQLAKTKQNHAFQQIRPRITIFMLQGGAVGTEFHPSR